MDDARKLSRRAFLKNGSIALGAAAASGLAAGIGAGIGEAGPLNAFAAQQPQEVGMPHVSVKIWPGRSEETKLRLAETIAGNVVEILGASPDSVSVSVEEVAPGRWKREVYDPLMRMNQKFVYKKPGYSM